MADNPKPTILRMSQTPTLTTSAYASGDLMGTLMKFKSGEISKNQNCIIQSIMISDLAKQDIEVDLVIFPTNPSNTTFTDNAALDINDTDLKTISHIEKFSSYYDFSDNSATVSQAMTIPTTYADGIYACLVSRGAGTYAASDITVVMSIIQDA